MNVSKPWPKLSCWGLILQLLLLYGVWGASACSPLEVLLPVAKDAPDDTDDSRLSVYGGRPAHPQKYASVVALIEITADTEGKVLLSSLVCTGVQIAPDVVLTAGHCLHPESYAGLPPQSTDATGATATMDPTPAVTEVLKQPWLPMDRIKLWEGEVTLPSWPMGHTKSLWIFMGEDLDRLQKKIVGLKDIEPVLAEDEKLVKTSHFKIFPTLWTDPLSHGDLAVIRLSVSLPFQTSFVFPWQTEKHQMWSPPTLEIGLENPAILKTLVGFGRREDGFFGQKYEAPLAFQNRLVYGTTEGFNVAFGGLYKSKPSPRAGDLRPDLGRITDSCDGDSGGPLFLSLDPDVATDPHNPTGDMSARRESTENALPVLWGLASYGVSLECGQGSVFQSLLMARCWIQDAVRGSPPHGTLEESVGDFAADPVTGQCRIREEGPWPIEAENPHAALKELCLQGQPASAAATLWALARSQGLTSQGGPPKTPPTASFCSTLAEELLAVTEVHLERQGLGDLRPLALLKRLQRLHLGGNQFKSIKVLAPLPAMTFLDVTGNLIQDFETFWSQIEELHSPAGVTALDLRGQNRQYFDRLWGVSQDRKPPSGTPPPPQAGGSFVQECEQRLANPPAKQRTFNALFARTQAQSCLQLWRRLLMVDSLALRQKGLTDLTPLKTFTHLTALDLSQNQDLTDVTPLAGLESLQSLKLKKTRVENLDSLERLIKRNRLTIDQ